ncbi:MAG: 4'-phosphopantetheinyl transferase superfamily protein, partial [Firmicutes bacterium]|nr:4'-phosphopantetheinyl transferase superfamily protein [Bacillota bacterium]
IPHLHPQERDYYDALKFEKRIKSYLMGRFVAKQAVAFLTGNHNLEDILIHPGIFTQPIVVCHTQNIQVSITHCDDFGVALAFPEAHPMAIDLEQMSIDKRDVIERQATDYEKDIINALSVPYDVGLTLLWTAKEALSKALKTGLMTPFNIFEISQIDYNDKYMISYYNNFAQYKAMSFTIGNYMCSMVYPVKTEVCFNIQACKAHFAFLNSANEGTPHG